MQNFAFNRSRVALYSATLLMFACSAPPTSSDDDGSARVSSASTFEDGPLLGQTRAPLTATERLAACDEDPRVLAGLVSRTLCAGADIFFRETFDGNGRTCGSCHPAANNTTLDVPFIQALHGREPNNPLFVFETDAALANLETRDLREAAAILENVDGFEDPTNA